MLAYTQSGWLYIVEIENTGELRKGSQPQKICRLPSHEVSGTMNWSMDGKYIAFSIYVPYEGGQLWVVEAKPGATPRKLGEGTEPAFAPTGHLLAYNYDGSVRIMDLDTNNSRTLREKSYSPHWSADGKEIALIDESEADNYGVTVIVAVVDAETGQHVSFRSEATQANTPLPSPDGRYIAFSPHLSRPKLSGIIANRQTGEELSLPHAGEPVLDWSSDSKWLLWTRWNIDPENDGAYLWREVWVTSPDGKNSRKIGDGYPARFAPDGKHVLYLRGRQQRPTDLYVADLQGNRQKLLLQNVDEGFAVQKK
jgi:Tol biopolymer transport system component